MPQPVSWSRIVKACPVINGTEFKVFDEYRFLDSGDDGAWARTEEIAERCGLSVRQVEDARANLVAYGLLVNERRGTRIHWWVRLPEPCQPPDRPSTREVVGFARTLAALIGSTANRRHGIPENRDVSSRFSGIG